MSRARIIRAEDLAETIVGRLNVYGSALQADLRSWRRQFGETLVTDALALVKARGQVDVDSWDERGHAHVVKVGLSRAVDDHHKAKGGGPTRRRVTRELALGRPWASRECARTARFPTSVCEMTGARDRR